jgi:hypothetical protein
MAKIKLISLYGIEPEFETRKPTDLSKITNKSFVINFERLKTANQFKHVWGKSNMLLANIVKNIHSKKGFNAAKELALKNMFTEQQNKLSNDLSLKKNKGMKPKF